MTFSCLTEEEVRRKYNEAEDKEYMVEVLAGLTCASATEIMRFLGLESKPKGLDKKYKEYTRIDREKAMELYNAGHTDNEIADALGVTNKTVGSWRRGLGLEINSRIVNDDVKRMELYRKGMNDAEIARALGQSSSAIQSWRRRCNLPANTTPGGDHRKKKEGEK